MSGVVKPTARKAVAAKPKGKKPPVGRLTQRVCDDCERDILVGYSSGIVVRLEPDLITPAAEPVLWSLGQPTYAVRRADAAAVLDLRLPTAVNLEPVAEIAIAHICDASRIWMSHTLTCPQWWGYSRYVVSAVGPSFRVLRAEGLADVYKEVLTCSTIEAAQEQVARLNWRDRARQIA